MAAHRVCRSWGKRQLVDGTAATIAPNLPQQLWRRRSSGAGTKGPRRHDWAYLELADRAVSPYHSALSGKWTRGLLSRRNIADVARVFFSTWWPKGTPMAKLVAVAGQRWAIADSCETANNALGLTTTRPVPGTAGTGTSRG